MKNENDLNLPFSKMRKRIAERLTYSKSHIPHFYLEMEIDLTAALALRAVRNSGEGLHLSVNDLVVKAAAVSLAEFEKMNSHVHEDGITVKKEINIGIAVAVADGLIVPVIPEADLKSVREISEISGKKISDAKRGVIDPGSPGTFTVTNLGMYGVRRFLPIINPPECGILAAGCVEKRIIYRNGGNEVSDLMSAVLACDHRGTDGVYAAQFLGRLKAALESPETIFAGGAL